MISRSCIALVLLCAALAAPAATSTDVTAVLSRVQGWLDGTRDLQARFEQTLVSGALGAGTRETGRLYLARPGRMRWEYAAPDAKVALLDGDRTLLYLPGDRQMLRGRLTAETSPLPALLAGSARLASVFEARLVGPVAGTRGAVALRLLPRRPSDGFEEVTLHVRAADGSIVGAEVVDGAGNRMLYRFSSMRRNGGVSSSVFRFVPPKGTEIIDQG